MNKAIIVLAVIIGIGVTSALACQCVLDTDSTLADEVKTSLKYETVFAGKVERFEFREGVPNKEIEEYQKTHPGFTWKTKIVILQVDRWWTGSLGPELVIATNETINSKGLGNTETSCDFSFEIGKSYLISAGKYDGYFRSPSKCGLSRKIEMAEKTLSLLGTGKDPVRTISQ